MHNSEPGSFFNVTCVAHHKFCVSPRGRKNILQRGRKVTKHGIARKSNVSLAYPSFFALRKKDFLDKLADSSCADNAKRRSASGVLKPLDPLTKNSALGPLWGVNYRFAPRAHRVVPKLRPWVRHSFDVRMKNSDIRITLKETQL